MGVLALIKNLEPELVVLEALAELLPCHFVSHILEDPGDLPLVIRVRTAFKMLTLALDDEDGGERKLPLGLALLHDEVRVDSVLPIPLHREMGWPDKISIPPQHLWMMVEVQGNAALVLVDLLRRIVKQALRNVVVSVVAQSRNVGPSKETRSSTRWAPTTGRALVPGNA